MLLKTSQEGIKNALQYVVKLPFTKHFLHRLSELARGKSIAYFSLHRLLTKEQIKNSHPHFFSQSALSVSQVESLLTHIQKTLPFVSMSDSLDLLTGQQRMEKSVAVLVLEAPYVQTIDLFLPLAEKLKIPFCLTLDTHSIHTGQMPWMDEIIYNLWQSSKSNIKFDFIDRPLNLSNRNEKKLSISHILDHLTHCKPQSLNVRLEKIRQALEVVSLPDKNESMANESQLKKLANNSLITFIGAGKNRLPLFDISLEEAKEEIIEANEQLRGLLGKSYLPVFFSPPGFDKRRCSEIVEAMMNHNFLAILSQKMGVCRPGDNMFHLKKLALAQGANSFEQFELQGLSDAIDEFLLVTLAKDKKFE